MEQTTGGEGSSRGRGADLPPWAGLQDRVRELEDQRAIREVLERYGHSIDYGLEAEWVDCFTEDAVWDVHPVAGQGGLRARCQGHRELAAFVATHTRAPDRWHKHVLVDPLIAVQGEWATATSYYLRIDTRTTGPYIRNFGRYRDRLQRGRDGRWRIAERIAEIEGADPDAVPPAQ